MRRHGVFRLIYYLCMVLITMACGGGGSNNEDIENAPIILSAELINPDTSNPQTEFQFNEPFYSRVVIKDSNMDLDRLYCSAFFPSNRVHPLVDPVPLFLDQTEETEAYESPNSTAGPYIGEYRLEYRAVDFAGNQSNIFIICC